MTDEESTPIEDSDGAVMDSVGGSFTPRSLSKLFPGYVFISEVRECKVRTFLVFRTNEADNCLAEIYDTSELTDERLNFFTKIFKKVKRFHHPNVDPLLDFWIHEGYLFLISTRKSSGSLESFIEEGRLAFSEYVEVGMQLTAALEAIHHRKLFHGGLMPSNIYINEELFVSLDTPLLYQLKVELGLIARDDPNRIKFLDINNDGFYASFQDIDMAAMGALICYLATGYPPHLMEPERWEHYGLSKELQTIVHRSMSSPEYKKYTTIREFMDDLDTLQLNKCSMHDVGIPCMRARGFRAKATNWNFDDKVQLVSEQEDEDDPSEDFEKYVFCSKPAKDLLFDKRFELIECIDIDELGASFSAIDHYENNKAVWLHLFENPQDVEWSHSFKKLARKLQRLKHRNIVEIKQWKLLEDVGYIVNEQENGLRIGEFISKNRLSYEEIIDFALQLTSAFDLCEKNGIQCYKLNYNDIAVYENEDGSYIYRLITVGHSSILHLSHIDHEQIDWLTSVETRPPEAYEGILRGTPTTQYILSQIIYKCVMGSHPCEGLSLEEALVFHKSIKRIDFGKYQDDIPVEFNAFYRRISSPMIERRFATAEEMYLALKQVAQCKATTRDLGTDLEDREQDETSDETSDGHSDDASDESESETV